MKAHHAAADAFLAALAGGSRSHSPLRLCLACVEALPIDRAALILVTEVDTLEHLGASDDVAAHIDGVQITLGAGPAKRAITVGAPVLVPDLAVTDERWPMLAASLGEHATGALYAFPLQLGAIRLGVLDLFRQAPGTLNPADLASALAVADAMTSHMLAAFAKGGLDESVTPALALSPSGRVVNQATGMVIAQLGVSPREAYVRLQGRAFTEGRLLSDVARDVVTRRLRLVKDT